MADITVITVVRDYEFYNKLVFRNPNFENAQFFAIDNRKENKFITVCYNEFLTSYDYSKESWFVFCHEDWELKENIAEKLNNLDKTALYGPIGCKFDRKRYKKICCGLIQHSHKDGSDLHNVGHGCKSLETVETFDCMCLIVHSSLVKKYDLRFDENLSFDLYVEDFCINAREKYDILSKVFRLECHHWSTGNITSGFYRQLEYLQNKYKSSRYFYFITCSQKPVGNFHIKCYEKLYFHIMSFILPRYGQMAKKSLETVRKNGIILLSILIKNKLQRCLFKKMKFPELAEKVLKFQNVESLKNSDFSIAVHFHLYYPDLLDEFIGYLNNIPWYFDLYVSCKENTDTEKIAEKLKKIKNVQKILIKEQKNRGRDILPFYVTFNSELRNYKYIFHIHTKKSFYLGKNSWRKNSLNALCGTENTVRKIFTILEEEHVGLVMGENYEQVNSLKYSWLSNWEWGKHLGDMLNISVEDKFFLFPAGSFFIARVDAIRSLFDLGLSEKDFPQESGQLDGTIAHGLERIIALVAENVGYKFCMVDLKWKQFRINGSEIPFRRLYQQSEKIANLKINHFKEPVFNIFDTLITRKCFRAEDVKLLAQERYGRRNVTSEEMSQIEYELAVPRIAMKNIYEKVNKKGKKIVLINNSAYSNETVSEILKKCGYSGWEKITALHDCSWNRRKNIYVCEFYGQSDKFFVEQRISRYYVLTPDFMLGISPLKKDYEKYDDGTPEGSRYLGEKLNNALFNSPFALNTLRRKD